MSTPLPDQQKSSPLYRTERVIASLTMSWVIILTTYMIFQNHELSYTSIYFLKIILAISGAVMLATLPGFFDLNYNVGGFSIRAAGGAAAFIFIYTQSPHLPAFQAERDATRPSEQEAHKPWGPTSSLMNGYPPLMILSFSPTAIVPPPAHPDYRSGSFAFGAEAGSSGIGRSNVQRLSFGDALHIDAGALTAAATTYAWRAWNTIKGWLDTAATAFRHAIGKLINAAQQLLGLGPFAHDAPPTIGLIAENAFEPLDGVTESLIGANDQLRTTLIANLHELGASMLDEIPEALHSVTALTNQTVGTLLHTVENSSTALLSKTQTVIGQTTQLLNETTSGLPTGLTRPISGVTEKLTAEASQDLLSNAVPATAKNASGILDSVDTGLSTITKRLNAASPAILSHINSDFVAEESLSALAKQAEISELLVDSARFDGILDQKIGAAELSSGRYILGKISDRVPAARQIGIANGTLRRPSGPLCVSGCDGGPNLGNAPGLSHAGLGSSPALGLGQGNIATPSAGSAVSSTVNSTSSVVGGTLGKLKRR